MDVFVTALSLGFLIYYIVKEAWYLISRRNCTYWVSAQIAACRDAGWSKHGRLYRCTVSYYYNDVRYSEDMAHTYRGHVFSEGESIRILIDESEPSRFMSQRERGTAICGLILSAVMLVALFLLYFGA